MSKQSRNVKFQHMEHRTKTHNGSNLNSLLKEASGYFRTNPFVTVNMYATFIASGKVIFPIDFDPFTLGFNHITFQEDITNGEMGTTECHLVGAGYDHDKGAFVYELVTPADADQPKGGTPVPSKAEGTAKFIFQKNTKGIAYKITSKATEKVNYICCEHKLQIVDGAKVKLSDGSQFVNDGALYQIYFSHIVEPQPEPLPEPAQMQELELEELSPAKQEHVLYFYKVINCKSPEEALGLELTIKSILTDGQASWVKNAVLDNIKRHRLSAKEVREIIAKGAVYPA